MKLDKSIIIIIIIIILMIISLILNIINIKNKKSSHPPSSHAPSSHPPSSHPPSSHFNKVKLLMGQSSIDPLDDYINNVDKTNKTLFGGSVYWSLQSNTFNHNMVGMDGECCYPNTNINCGNGCALIGQTPLFEQNGIKINSDFFRQNLSNNNNSKFDNLHAYSTTNILNNNTEKYGKYLLVAINLKEDYYYKNSEAVKCNLTNGTNVNECRYNYLNDIIDGNFDKNLEQINYIIDNNPNIHFLFRIGYEIMLSYFVIDKNDTNSWLNAREKWIKAYTKIARNLKYKKDKQGKTIKRSNVQCILHIGQEVLYSNVPDHYEIINKMQLKYSYIYDNQGDKNYTTVEIMMNDEVDIIGFSLFSVAFSNTQDNCNFSCTNDNKSCNKCVINSGSKPCVENIQYNFGNVNDNSPVRDMALRANMYVAKQYYNKDLMICESGMLSPFQCSAKTSIDFLTGIYNVIKEYNIKYWSFIGGNSWKKTGWTANAGWPQWPFWKFEEVKKYFINHIFPILDKKD